MTGIHSWLIGLYGAAESPHDQAAAGQAHLSNSEQSDFSVKQFIDSITQESEWNICLNNHGVKTLQKCKIHIYWDKCEKTANFRVKITSRNKIASRDYSTHCT